MRKKVAGRGRPLSRDAGFFPLMLDSFPRAQAQPREGIAPIIG